MKTLASLSRLLKGAGTGIVLTLSPWRFVLTNHSDRGEGPNIFPPLLVQYYSPFEIDVTSYAVPTR